MSCGAYTLSINSHDFQKGGPGDYSGSLPRAWGGDAAAAGLPARCPQELPAGPPGLADAQQAGGQAHGAPQAAEAHVAELALMAYAVACQRAARCRRKSASNGVGRPVLPFCAPLW